MVCPTCQRSVSDADALFCAGCGAPLPPPTTIELAEPALPDETPMPPAHLALVNRKAAFVGMMGAALAIIGAFQVWLRIRIAGFIPPGSAETGWRGGDGRTIVLAAAVAGVAAGALWAGRRDLWLKIALLIAGGITIVIALVHMVDAGSKARDIEVQFGIPSSDVSAQVGVGLYLVVVGGVGLLVAGLQARTASS
ncbi:MAG: hypothetical protein QOH79_2936 [Acidimicrobiaceae bacterium]